MFIYLFIYFRLVSKSVLGKLLTPGDKNYFNTLLLLTLASFLQTWASAAASTPESVSTATRTVIWSNTNIFPWRWEESLKPHVYTWSLVSAERRNSFDIPDIEFVSVMNLEVGPLTTSTQGWTENSNGISLQTICVPNYQCAPVMMWHYCQSLVYIATATTVAKYSVL